MFKYSFGFIKESEAIEQAVAKILDSGIRTADIANPWIKPEIKPGFKTNETKVSCSQMGDKILGELKKICA